VFSLVNGQVKDGWPSSTRFITPSSDFCSRSPYVHLYKFRLAEASKALHFPLFSLSSAVGPTALLRSISKSEDSFGCSLVAQAFSIRSGSHVRDVHHIRVHPAFRSHSTRRTMYSIYSVRTKRYIPIAKVIEPPADQRLKFGLLTQPRVVGSRVWT
jgi:hypothetical protein